LLCLLFNSLLITTCHHECFLILNGRLPFMLAISEGPLSHQAKPYNKMNYPFLLQYNRLPRLKNLV